MAIHSVNKQDPDKAKVDNDSNIEFTEDGRSFLNLMAEIIVEIVMQDDEEIENNIPT